MEQKTGYEGKEDRDARNERRAAREAKKKKKEEEERRRKKKKEEEEAKKKKEEEAKKKKERIAVVTIGRWQPPHAGHLELINGTYNKVLKLRAKDYDADGFIWITSRPDEKNPDAEIGGDIINKNPLYFIDKWLYINYILPVDTYDDKLNFLHITNIDNDINQKVFNDDDDDDASFLKKNHDLRKNVNEDEELSECLKVKYDLLFKYGKEDFNKFKKRTFKINVRNQQGSPSATCIEFLKSRGYKKLLLLVGSDRVEAFKKYNNAHLKDAFGAGNGIIEQIGADRGSAGNGLLFDINNVGTKPSAREKTMGTERQAQMVLNYCSINGCGGGGEGEGGEEKSRERSESIAGTFSGTRIRNCAYKLENLDYFCKGTIIGGMTKELSFCLLNDLRKRHVPELDPITKSVWNEKVSPEYQFFGLGMEHDEGYSRMALFNAQHGNSSRGGRKRKTRKRGRVPIKYVPKRLTKKDKKKARKELKKSRKAYKKGKYYTRKKVKSFKSKKSSHIINAMKIYKVKSVSASAKLSKKSGCSVTGLKKLVSKGAGAYYSSGSRPNQTATSWGRARMASSITGGKAAAVDFKILEKYCKPNSKALKLAKKAKKKHGYGTRKVRKVKL